MYFLFPLPEGEYRVHMTRREKGEKEENVKYPREREGEMHRERRRERLSQLLFFLLEKKKKILRQMGKKKELKKAPTLARIRCTCFNLTRRFRCNSSSRCCYQAREHVDPT